MHTQHGGKAIIELHLVSGRVECGRGPQLGTVVLSVSRASGMRPAARVAKRDICRHKKQYCRGWRDCVLEITAFGQKNFAKRAEGFS
jgi:hypothetical protein